MGGGVEHHVGLVGIEQQLQPPGIPDGADLCAEGQIPAVLVQQLLLDVVGVVLVNIEDDQPFGMVLDDLAAQLAADGAAATGDQHGTPGQQARHGGNVQLNGIPAQQILDPHLPQLLADGLPVDQLQRAGQRGNSDAPVCQLTQDLFAVELIHGRDGEDSLVDVHGPHPRQGLVNTSADRHTPDPLIDLGRVIVKKALDAVTAVGVVLQFIQQLHPCRAGANDGHRHRTRLISLHAEGTVHPVAKPHSQHFQYPQAGDGRQQNKGNGLVKQSPAENFISTETADGRAQQRQILPALSIAPQAVIGLAQKLSNDGAPIQQQHIFREAAFNADLGIGQQHRDELVTSYCHRE